MTLSALLTQTVIVRSNGTAVIDDEGNTTRPSTDTTYQGRLADQVVVETNDGTPATEQQRWLLYLPAGAVIGPHDRVVVDGVTYEVDGVPYRALNGSGGEHHVEAHLVGVS